MSRRATVEPAWLDAMLVAWGRASLFRTGWYGINPMLKDGIPTKAESFEPIGLTHLDYRDLEKAIDGLGEKHKMAVIRAYKPWTARAMELEAAVYGANDRVWRHWLDEAAGLLLRAMDTAKNAA
jgi:hypothetical protein